MRRDQDDPFDPQNKQLRPLADYSRRLPSSHPGRRLNRSTLFRWALHGTKGGVRLRTVRIGNGRFTSDADFAEFIAARDAIDTALVEPTESDLQAVSRVQQRFGGKP